MQDGGSGRGWATGRLGNWVPTGAQSWRDAAGFVLQRHGFLFFVKPELEMRVVGLELERMGVGRGLSHSLLFQMEFSFAPLENAFLFSIISIVKKFSLGSREQIYLNEV